MTKGTYLKDLSQDKKIKGTAKIKIHQRLPIASQTEINICELEID
jgi:hypothetical protein